MKTTAPMSADRIRAMMLNAAKLVEVYGEIYLDLFEALEQQLLDAESREERLSRVLKFASTARDRVTNRAQNV